MRLEDMANEIEKNLHTTRNQANKMAKEIGTLKDLQEYFRKYPKDESEDLKNKLDLAERALDYKRPYRIAVIGRTGVGKSAFTNALLGRNLVFTKPMGKAATGTVLEIYQTAESVDEEKAVVEYRSDDDLRQLIKDAFVVPNGLSSDIIGEMLGVSKPEDILDIVKNAAGDIDPNITDGIIDIVKQYIHHGQNQQDNNQTFLLQDPEHVEILNALIDENSELNARDNNERRIGLIKRVAYHITPKQDEDTTALQLPRNACLIDLPGIDATELHNHIIKHDIKEADAVVFIFDPERMEQLGEVDMMKSIAENIGINGPEQIFIVLNRWDEFSEDDKSSSDISSTVEKMKFFPDGQELPKRVGDQPFFPTSALAAHLASNDHESNEYKEFLRKLEADDHEQLIEKSGMPDVVKALNNLAGNNIDTRIKDATDTLNSILDTLEEMHQPGEELPNLEEKLLEETSRSNDKELENMQEMMLKSIDEFTAHQLVKRSDLKRELESRFDAICTSVNEELQRTCPDMWKSIRTDRDKLRGRRDFSLAKKAFITKANITVWHLLSKELVGLAEKAAEYYRKEFSEEKVLETLYEGGKNLQATKEAFSQESINRSRKKLKENLSQATNRSAVAILCDPEHFFIEEEEPQVQESGPSDESNQQHSTDSERDEI